MAQIPNFGALAGQQKSANDFAVDQTTQANRPNQYNTFGSTTWTRNPDGSWGQTTALNQPAQTLFDQSMGAQGNILGQISQGSPVASFGAQQNVIDAWNRLQQPGLDQRAQAARARASAMGLTMGSDSYNTNERNIADTYRTSEDTAIGKGVDAWNQLYDRQLQGYNANRGALGDITQMQGGMNPTKWSSAVPESGKYTPETVYGAGLDTFNAQMMNENAARLASQGDIQGYIQALNAAGGYKGIKELGGDLWSGAKSLYNDWGNWTASMG